MPNKPDKDNEAERINRLEAMVAELLKERDEGKQIVAELEGAFEGWGKKGLPKVDNGEVYPSQERDRSGSDANGIGHALEHGRELDEMLNQDLGRPGAYLEKPKPVMAGKSGVYPSQAVSAKEGLPGDEERFVKEVMILPPHLQETIYMVMPELREKVEESIERYRRQKSTEHQPYAEDAGNNPETEPLRNFMKSLLERLVETKKKLPERVVEAEKRYRK